MLPQLLFASVLALATYVKGAAFRMPLSKHVDTNVSPLNRPSQLLLASLKELDGSSVSQLAIRAQYSLFFQVLTTKISIGSPPQEFVFTLDTGHVDPLIVPSISCISEGLRGCFPSSHWPSKYNSTLSESYKPGSTWGDFDWGGVRYDGVLSRDVLTFGHIHVPDVLFLEWSDQLCISFGCSPSGRENGSGFDGILGLGPPWASDEPEASVLGAMSDSGVLDEPVFSLQLPNAFQSTGELTLGASYHPPNAHDPISIQLNEREPGDHFNSIQTAWPIEFRGLRIDVYEADLKSADFSNHTAVIVSSFPGIMLPGQLGSALNAVLFHQCQTKRFFCWFNCEMRKSLPGLSLQLGPKGTPPVNVSAFDYTHDFTGYVPPENNGSCLSMLSDAAAYNLGEDLIVLGSAFLGAFHTTFDFNRRRVSFAKLEYDL